MTRELKLKIGVAVFSAALSVAAQTTPPHERVQFRYIRSQVAAYSSASVTNGPLSDFGRIPGGGRVIREWKVTQPDRTRLQIEGIVQDDNVGGPTTADFLLGNLSKTNVLTLIGSSDAAGRFKLVIPCNAWWAMSYRATNHTLNLRDLAGSNLVGMAKGTSTVAGVKGGTMPASPSKPVEEIFEEIRFLYVGREDTDLYCYRIPYEIFDWVNRSTDWTKSSK